MTVLVINPGVAALPPAAVTSLTVGAISSTMIVVSYTSGSGSSGTVSFAGWTAVHGSGQWVQNTGSFGASGGSFVGLSPGTQYDLRIVVSNAVGSAQTNLLTGVTTSLVAASSFTLAASASHGQTGAPVTLTVTPSGGAWPSGETVVPSVAGLAGTFDNASLVGVGSAPLTFTFTPVSTPGNSGSFSATAAGMSNNTGALLYAIDAVAASAAANRFDAVAAASSVAPGASVTVTLSPNGTWPNSGTITPTTSGNGTFSPASLTLSGGSQPLSISYTPSAAGEHNLSFTAGAGLFAPYPVPLNVFAAATGAAQTISAALVLGDQAVHQRDAPSGNPLGFSVANTKGWGEVWVSVGAISGPTSALFARLYDAQSSGASSAAGSGTALHAGPVQVYGPLSASGTVRLLLPAVRAKLLYLDLATDAAFTNPVRLSNRFKVGTVIAVATRSQLTGWFRGFAEPTSAAPTSPWQQTAVSFATDYRYAVDAGNWYRLDGGQGDPSTFTTSKVSGEPCSNAAMEAGRLLDQQLGTMLGVVGVGATSGGLDEFISSNGAMSGTFQGMVQAASRNKFRFLVIASTFMDNSTETTALDRQTYSNGLAQIPLAYPGCAVIGWNTGATGIYGSDGSQPMGFVRNQSYFLAQAEPVNPMVVALTDHGWNAFNGGHCTQAARLMWIRAHVMLLLTAERSAWGGLQTAQRGPTFATAGTVTHGTNVISVPFRLNGATTLRGSKIAFTSDTTSTLSLGAASATDLASLFAVYNSGGYVGNGSAIQVASVAISTSSPPSGYDGSIQITLTGTPGTVTYASGATGAQPTAMTVQALSDFGASGGTGVPTNVSTVLHGDIDPLSVGLGAQARPQLDIAITTV